MNIIITGRKIDVTEGLKTAIDSKLKKFDKFSAIMPRQR